jgi:hypothetical protein
VLDLSIFGLTKRLIARVNRFDEANVQSVQIARVVCSFMSAANPFNIMQSFRNAGISLIIADDKLLCAVTPETARCLMDREKVLSAVSGFSLEELDVESWEDASDDDSFDGEEQTIQ